MRALVGCCLPFFLLACGDERVVVGPGGVLRSQLESDDSAVLYSHSRLNSGGVVIEESRSAASEAELRAAILTPEAGDDSRRVAVEVSTSPLVDGTLRHNFLIRETPRRMMSMEERVAYNLDMVAQGLRTQEDVDLTLARLLEPPTPTARPKLAAHRAAELATMSDDEPVLVELCGLRKKFHLPRHAILAEVLGLDRAAAREALDQVRIDRQEDVANLTSALEVDAEAIGIRVEFSDVDRPCLTGWGSAANVREALSLDAVSYVHINDDVSTFANPEQDGLGTRHASQAQQFVASGFTGESPSSRSGGFNDITVAVIDEGFQDMHLAFRDGTTSTTRIHGRYRCEFSPSLFPPDGCLSQSDLTYDVTDDDDDHGTNVAAVIAADLNDGQDSNFTVSADRESRTFMAPEAGLVLFRAPNYGTTSVSQSITRAISLDVDGINYSDGFGTSVQCAQFDVAVDQSAGSNCQGESDTLSDKFNLAFEDGIFVVKSAGNQSQSRGACNCTATQPADADGVFAVARLNTACTNSHDVARTAGIGATSSEGGGEFAGATATSRERSLIGLATMGNHANLAACTPSGGGNGTCDDSALSEYVSCNTTGTSFAAPVVAGAAVLVKDHWIAGGHSPATWLDDAANMRAMMLLMGDREGGSGKIATGFSPKFGAGRLKLRKLNDAGMDAPWNFESGYVTVSDGEVYSRYITEDGLAGTIEAGADRLVVVAWWYEEIPDASSFVSDITLTLERRTSDCSGLVSAVGDTSRDNKKRVAITSNVGGNCYLMKIVGNGGIDKEVHWALYYEDTARNDGDGPDLNAPVQPLDVELP